MESVDVTPLNIRNTPITLHVSSLLTFNTFKIGLAFMTTLLDGLYLNFATFIFIYIRVNGGWYNVLM